MSVNKLEKGGSFRRAIGELLVERLAEDLRPGSYLFDGDAEAHVKRSVLKAM